LAELYLYRVWKVTFRHTDAELTELTEVPILLYFIYLPNLDISKQVVTW
jgi:hypothetical protein